MIDDRFVPDTLGGLCDGWQVTVEEINFAMQALIGSVDTERGIRFYYADLDVLMLNNVDTAEGIWSVGADNIIRGGRDKPLVDLNNDEESIKQCMFPLMVIGDNQRMARWQQAMQRANNEQRKRWARFNRRVLKHLIKAFNNSGLAQ